MKKGLYYKILSTFVLISLLLFNIVPFSIYANGSLTAPFLGYNWRLIDYNFENQTTYSLNCSNSTTTGTFDTQGSGTGDSISLGPITDTSGRTYYSTGATNGGVRLTGTISINSSNGCSLSNTNTLNRYSVLEVDILLDNNYVGSVDLTIYGYNKTYYVNGNVINASILINGSYNENTNYSISINSYDLYLNNNIRWDFPIESYSFATQLLNNYPNKLTGINQYNMYMFPIFSLSANDKVYDITLQHSSRENCYFVIYVNHNIWNQNTLNNVFSWDIGDIIFDDVLANLDYIYSSSDRGKIIKFHVNNTGSSTTKGTLTLKSNKYIMPILAYLDTSNFKLSTDFALNFGMSNPLLDNINIIANGTNSSNQSSSTANSTNQSLNQEGQKVENIENQLVSDFDSSMNNITVDSPLNILGSGFVQSANWVRTQFDTLTTNTPFGTLITFSLILGIGLLIIGKVFG